VPEERETMLQEAGKKIRRKREELGLTLEDVHEATKIRINFLQGIEQGDYSGFPGTVYVRGFIRTYLQFLGAEELWSEFLPILSEGVEKKRSQEPVVGTCTPPTTGFKPASRFWLIALLLLVVMGSGWYVWYSWEQSEVPLFNVNRESDITPGQPGSGEASGGENTERVSETLVLAGTNDPPAGSASLEPGVSHDPDAPGAKGAAEGQDSHPSTPPTAAQLIGVAAPVETSPAPVEEKKDKELVISANGDCWIRVRQGTRTIYERTIKAGDTINFKVTERLNVTYGRANVVTVTWNGKDTGSPGRGVERIYYAPDGSTGRFN
jgi:cytoskeletal protein RodZ